MVIMINGFEYTVEECFVFLGINDNFEVSKKDIFDEFGNYVFGTDIVLDKPNTVSLSNIVFVK